MAEQKDPDSSKEEVLVDTKKRVAVVGGGVVGLCTAWHLCERGYDVTVLEKAANVATAGSSFNPCGIIGGTKVERVREGDKYSATFAGSPWHILKTLLPRHKVGSTAILMDAAFLREIHGWKFAISYFKRRFVDEPLRKCAHRCKDNKVGGWLLKHLSRHSAEDFSSVSVWPVSNGLRQLYFRKVFAVQMWAKFFDKNGAFFKDVAVWNRRYDVEIDAKTQQLFGPPIDDELRAALKKQFDEDNGGPQLGTTLKCNVFVSEMAELCEASGKVSVVCGKQVSRIGVDGDNVSGVQTADGHWLAFDKVVLCTGHWTPALMRTAITDASAKKKWGTGASKARRLWLPIVPVQGFTLTYDYTPEYYSLPFHSIGWKDSNIFLHAAYFQEFGELNTTGFGMFRPMKYAVDYDIKQQQSDLGVGNPKEDAVFEALEREVKAKALPLFGSEALAKAKSKWAGFRPVTADEFPIVSKVPRVSGLYLNAGHGRAGVELGMGTAHLLATLVDTPTDDLPQLERGLLNAMSLERFLLKPYLL